MFVLPAHAGGQSSDTQVSVTDERVRVVVNGVEIVIDIGPDGKPVLATPEEPAKPEPTHEPGKPEQPPAAEESSLAEQVFEETNRFRAEHNLPPFERDTCLDKTATEKTKHLIESGKFEHGSLAPAEKECETSVGENIAWVAPADADTVAREFVYDIWAKSTEGHREAMLSTEYTHMGVRVEPNGQGGFHATQQFTTRDKTDAPEKQDRPADTPPAEPVATEAPATGLEAEEGLTPEALTLLRQVHQKWPDLKIGGVRPDSKPDHPSGRALDVMTGGNDCNPVGQEIADWAKSHADHLGVHYVIWCGKIWNADRADEGWRPNTGHRDHVHISVRENSRA